MVQHNVRSPLPVAHGRNAPEGPAHRVALSPQVRQLQALHTLANASPQSQAAARWAALAATGQPPVQRAKAETMGGTWETLIYAEHHQEHGKGVETKGADIKLAFTPNAIVQAEKIGLTQSIRALMGGEVSYLGDKEGERNVSKSRTLHDAPHKGVSIDRLPSGGQNNPIYGASTLPQNADIEDTTMPEQNEDTREEAKPVKGIFNQLGKRQGAEVVPAVLSDTPRRQTPLPPHSRQEFETTALAIKGPQKGTYYGSVKWGWETDGKGTFKLIDFGVVREGQPTDSFFAGADQWGKGFSRFAPFSGEAHTPNIPLPGRPAPGLLPLPGPEAYDTLKKQATKAVSLGSGMMPRKSYNTWQAAYQQAVTQGDLAAAKDPLNKIEAGLAAMDQKGDAYWKSADLKAQYFTPLYLAAQGQKRLLAELQG